MERRIPTLDQFIIESNELVNEDAKILSKEFGGDDHKDFLHIAWRMKPDELKDLLKTAESDMSVAKKNSKGVLGLFNKRDALLIKARIEFINQILKSKKDDPDFIADLYK